MDILKYFKTKQQKSTTKDKTRKSQVPLETTSKAKAMNTRKDNRK